MAQADIREIVKDRCGQIALQASGGDAYRRKLAAAGFKNIAIEPTRIYRAEDARTFMAAQGVDVEKIAPQVDGKLMSAFIPVEKPAACCASTCCA